MFGSLTVMSRSACTFHVLHKQSVDRLRSEIPVLNSLLNKVRAIDQRADSIGHCEGDLTLVCAGGRRGQVQVA